MDAALKSGESTDPQLQGWVKTAQQLETLRSVPPLEKEEFTSAKAAFLAQASAMAPQETGAIVDAQKTSWVSQLKETLQFNHEKTWVPVSAMVALCLIFLAVFGFNSLNRAAQVSLPGDALYPFKVVREDLSASLTFDAYNKVMIYLEQIQERQQEIARFALNGQAPPPQTVSRLEAVSYTHLRAHET